jgi:4-coumarate--CoA ligase
MDGTTYVRQCKKEPFIDDNFISALLIRLVNDPVADQYTFSHAKQFNTGAAPMPKEIIHKLATKFPHIAIRQAWGMTESTSALTMTYPHSQTYNKAHMVGQPVPDTIIKVMNPETGKEVADGVDGEVGA